MFVLTLLCSNKHSQQVKIGKKNKPSAPPANDEKGSPTEVKKHDKRPASATEQRAQRSEAKALIEGHYHSAEPSPVCVNVITLTHKC